MSRWIAVRQPEHRDAGTIRAQIETPRELVHYMRFAPGSALGYPCPATGESENDANLPALPGVPA